MNEDGYIEISINGIHRLKAEADTGATANAISEQTVQKLKITENIQKTQTTKAILLDTNMKLDVMGKIHLDISIPSKAGNVRIQKEEFYIVKGNFEHVILGRQLLKDKLGIDIPDLIYNLQTQNKMEMEENEPNTKDEDILKDQDENELNEALEHMLSAAIAEGLPVAKMKEFEQLIYSYKDVWRTHLAGDPPADVPPMKIKLKPTVEPVRTKLRRYPPVHRKFLEQRMKKLLKYKMQRRNARAKWISPAYVIAKVKNPEDLDNDYRLTVDHRAINQATIPTQFPLPNLDVITSHLKDARYFFNLDLLKGFFQFPLDEESQEYFSYCTDKDVYTPGRVPMGATDAVMYCQSTLQNCFEKQLYRSLLIWMDDLLGYAKTIDELYDALGQILSVCRQYGLKLNAKKCKIFTQSTTFCGKIYNKNGMKQDPEKVKALQEMPEPTTAGQLQQFLCSVNWMRQSLPNFARVARPLRELLETNLKGKKKTKRIAKGISLKLNEEERESYKQIKELLGSITEQAHPDDEAELCICTDASQYGWAIVVFQIRGYKENLLLSEQNCEPIYFLSGLFKDAQLNWSIIEKEGYPIIEATKRLDYLLLRQKGFKIFTDHRNLIYIFTAERKNISLPTSHRLQRWALQLASFKYTIEHIDGEQNVWADMLSRWGQATAPTVKKEIKIRAMSLHPLEEENEFPTLEKILQSQQENKKSIEAWSDTELKEGLYYKNGKIIIPDEDKQLQLRIMIVAHFGLSGHRGTKTTTEKIENYCTWTNLVNDVTVFCRRCLHCLHVKGGRVIPRPYGRTLQATKRREIIHFDFLYLGEAYNGQIYILVIKDGFSHFVELIPCVATTAEVTCEAILDWISRYGSMKTWVSDQGSHFKNKLMEELKKRLKKKHHFTTAYCPWANSNVERVNRDVLAILKSLLSEFKLANNEWPTVIKCVQFVINNTRSEVLANEAPITVFMGFPPEDMIEEIFDPQTKKFVEIPENTETIKNKCEELAAVLRDIHKAIPAQKEKRHQRNKKSQGKIKFQYFDVGEYVLWSNVDTITDKEKLMVTWKGPYRIVKTVSDWVYEIEHIVTKKTREVHVTRMKYYIDKDLDVSEELIEHIARQGFELEVNEIKDLRYNSTSRRWETLISWKGFEVVEDSWEPFLNIFTDIPRIVINYLVELKLVKPAIVKKLMKAKREIIEVTSKKKNLDISPLQG